MAWSLVGSAGAVANSGTSPMTASAGQSSTAGNLLICRVTITSGATAPTLPTGWAQRKAQTVGTSPLVGAWAFEYRNNPGSISSVSVTFGAGHAAAQVTEYTCPNVALVAADQVGSASGAIASPLNITTPALAANTELAVSAIAANFGTATTTTFGAGSGFSQTGNWNNGSNQTAHAAFDHDLSTGASAGSTVTDAVTLSVTGAGNEAGVIVTYSQPLSVTLTTSVPAAGSLSNNPANTLSVRVSTTATVTRRAGKVLACSVTTAGTLSRQAGQMLATVAATSGSITRSLARSFSVPVIMTAALSSRVSRVLTAAVTTAGALRRAAGKILAALVRTAGSLSTGVIVGPRLPGVLTITPGPGSPQTAVLTVAPAGAQTAVLTITPMGNNAASLTVAAPLAAQSSSYPPPLPLVQHPAAPAQIGAQA